MLVSRFVQDAGKLERQLAARREAAMLEDRYDLELAMRHAAWPRHEGASRQPRHFRTAIAAALTALAVRVAPSA